MKSGMEIGVGNFFIYDINICGNFARRHRPFNLVTQT